MQTLAADKAEGIDIWFFRWYSCSGFTTVTYLILIIIFIIKFSYNARSDWLKKCDLSENRARVDDCRLALKFFHSEFWKIWLKLNIPCDSDKRNGNELYVCSKYGSRRLLLATAVLQLY